MQKWFGGLQEIEATGTLCCIKTKLAKNGMKYRNIESNTEISCHSESDYWPICDECY